MHFQLNSSNVLATHLLEFTIHLTANSNNNITTVIYGLIGVATITLSKQKGVATKQGRLLYKGGN